MNVPDPRRPQAVQTEGVPPVPESIFERLHPYQNVRSAAFCGWAPDGEGVLIRTRFGNADQLHRVARPGAVREQMTFFDEPVTGRFLRGAHDGTLMVVLSHGGDENYQVYRLTPGRGPAERLTDGSSRNLMGPQMRDGSRMILASNRRHRRDMDLYTMDPRDPHSLRLLLQTDGQVWRPHEWTADGRWILVDRVVSHHETYPALLDAATGRLRPIPPPGGGVCSFECLRFAADARSAYVSTVARGEFQELASVDLETFEFTWLAEDIPWDVTEIEVDAHTGRIAFTANENGANRLYLLDQGIRRTIDLPLGVVGDLEFSPDGRHLGFTLARADAPADVYSAEMPQGALTRWTASETGGLDPEGFVQPAPIEVRSFDGLRVPGYYLRPPGATKERPAPVVILIHGGPESQYRPSFAPGEQFYVKELGCAIVGPNVRGSSGYGKSYLALDNAEKREDSVRDIGGILDWIAEQPELDSARVAVSGGSYGGYMVLAALIHFGDRIRAGIDRVGIANFVTFLERTSAYRQDLRRAEYGDERDPKMRARLIEMSPTTHADRIRSALLIAHGANDPRVPLFEAQQIAQRVRAEGGNVWTLYAQNEGHGFARKDNLDYLSAVNVLFLRTHLL